MPDQVNVEDFEVFRQFRAALLKFARAADQSLSGAESEISRTHAWLENEQMTFWIAQRRKRAEAVAKAKDAVRQKKLYKDATGRYPGAVEEEKALAKCMAAIEEAESKIELIRKWLPKFEKAADLFRGGVSRLHLAIGGDIPRAVALLDRLGLTLEQYAQIEVPISAGPSSASSPGESFSRPADLPETPPTPAPATETPPSPATPTPEARDVPHGL